MGLVSVAGDMLVRLEGQGETEGACAIVEGTIGGSAVVGVKIRKLAGGWSWEIFTADGQRHSDGGEYHTEAAAWKWMRAAYDKA